MTQPLPFEITQEMIQCFGKSFHYKDGLAAFMLSAGVEPGIIDQHRNQPKFVWGRNVLTELGQSQQGRITQRRLLTELCKLTSLPDDNV